MEDDFGKPGGFGVVELIEAPAPASRAERRDQQVQRILDASKICFVRSGFQGASMQQICAEAGMSPGALYRYFASKEAIIEAICEADRREDAERFAVILQTPDVVEGMVMGAMAHIRHIHDEQLAALFAEINAEAMRNGAIDCLCRKNMNEVMQAMHAYLDAALQRGDIAPVVPLDVLMPALMAVCHGVAVEDLPTKGITLEQIETIMRSTAEALLRPTRTNSNPN